MDTNKTTLAVMAAGMGSRFGGLKQIEPLGPNGEVILDYSVYDAKKAGFSKVVFIIKKAIEKDFREIMGKRIEKLIDVDYSFQELDKELPKGFAIPQGREKPWGTTHAILCARNEIKTPFAVINADDFYGYKAYDVINKHLQTSKKMCMVAYELHKTLSDNGSVARGVCDVKEGYLSKVTEHLKIEKENHFPSDTFVSMNMWGLMPEIFETLEEEFNKFIKINTDLLKGECLIPVIIDKMINEQSQKVKVLTTDETWFGVTYKEDKPFVVSKILELTNKGLYNNI